jgi:putative NADH-flavin reductase
MNVILFGATGNLGPLVLEKLLAKNTNVTVFARNPKKIAVQHQALKVVAGDARDEQVVIQAIASHDAVVNAIGGEYDANASIRSLAVDNIINGMKRANIQRLVNLGGVGILQVGGWFLYKSPVFPKDFVPASREHHKVFETLQQSDLEWTMVCPPKMTNAKATGRYQTRADKPYLFSKMEIPLGDVADFITQEISQRQYIRQRVAIAMR